MYFSKFSNVYNIKLYYIVWLCYSPKIDCIKKLSHRYYSTAAASTNIIIIIKYTKYREVIFDKKDLTYTAYR